MTKPNRNDRCPCGSGEKFKKCCIDIPEYLRRWPQTTPPTNPALPSFLIENNSSDLLTSFAALSVLPENHGKNVRLELLALATLQAFNTSINSASKTALKSFLDKNYPSHRLEDPQTNLFTDLVSYHGGDYLVFPGITETGTFVLTNLLTAINHWPDTYLPKGFKVNCHHGIRFILGISDAIACSMGYNRYMQGDSNEELIEFPSDEIFDHARRAVEFSKEQMKTFLNERGIAEQVVSRFSLDRNAIDFNGLSIEDSPVMEHPIIESPSGFLVISPTALVSALTSFIWDQAEAFDCTKEVEHAYNSVTWNDAQYKLSKMGYELLKVEEIIPFLGQWDNLYRFDTDKIALIRLISPSRVSDATEKRLSSENLLSKLKENPAFKDEQFIDISLISGTGQMVMHPIMRNSNARVLSIELYEFNVLGDLELADAIDIWNFATALDEQAPEGTLHAFSFLDTFKLYKENDDSFYISDKSKYNYFHVQPGYGADYIFKAKQNRDVHSIPFDERGRILRIPVVRKDKYFPIYCNPNDLMRNVLRFAVEGFPQSMWVMPNFSMEDVHGDFRHTLFEINNTIAFWLSQICDGIRDYFKPLSDTPISVRFDLKPIEKFQSFEHDFTRDPRLSEKFKWSASKSEIVIQIPAELIAYFYGSDNEGERVLVKNLVLAFNELFAANGVTQIPAERIDLIVDEGAPLGMKKKFVMLDSSDNLLLDQRNLVGERRIREYNVGAVLNSIVPGLGDKAPAEGEITTKEDKLKLTRAIVGRSLLPSLKKAISQYDCEELLSHLIERNEALIERREFYNVNTPSRIACYVSVEQHGIDWMKTSSEINRTTLALRCLMEHVAAEQSRGVKKVSMTGVDELVAIMHQIITWGSIGDEVNYDLFNTNMAILPSGRVGTGKDHVKQVLEPFYEIKIHEDIQDSIEAYDSVFAQRFQRNGKDVPEFVDKAFVSDYGISFTRVCELMGALSLTAFQSSPNSYMKMPLLSMREEINKQEDPFSEAEFKAGMDFLTLTKRNKVDEAPKGFDNIDISPWRFNRRLSILRRPFMVIQNSNDANNPWVYWGPRQVLHTRIYIAEQIQSGRLKVPEGGSVIKALGRLAQEKGDALVRSVLKSVKSDDLDVHTEVWIGPKEVLYDPNDLGDVDVLIIDKQAKTIYSLECKSIEPSRNVKEMVEEVSKLKGSDSEKGLIQKHVDRDTWLKNNKVLLGKKFVIDLSEYEIKSFFVTAEGMLTPFLQKQSLPLPFVTSYDLKKFGMAALTAKRGATTATEDAKHK